jgi:hypothetical protein
MADTKKNKPAKYTAQKAFAPLFTKENYWWMAIGGAIMALGMIVMSGGKNPDPNVFNNHVTYSFTRITIAPILILVGIVVEIYAIFKKPKKAVE